MRDSYPSSSPPDQKGRAVLPDGTTHIDGEDDIVYVRKQVRDLASGIGFNLTDVTRIITAASELARNIYRYAGKGRMKYAVLHQRGAVGIELEFQDEGPGIADIPQAMEPGYTTSRGLGLGLPGSKRMMDEFHVWSEVGKGTIVTIRKWKRNN